MELKNEESQAVVFASGLLDTLVNILESGDMVSKVLLDLFLVFFSCVTLPIANF